MTTPDPKPRKSRRMIVWLVVAPIVILLLALAGANWKTFHLAYAKHLLKSKDAPDRQRGLKMLLRTHVNVGMSPEEVRLLLGPLHQREDTRNGLLEITAWGLHGNLSWSVAFVFDKDNALTSLILGFTQGSAPSRWGGSVRAGKLPGGRFQIPDNCWPEPEAKD